MPRSWHGVVRRTDAAGVIYGGTRQWPEREDVTVARDPETIEREIERARSALAESLDVLTDRASPRRLADTGRQNLQSRLQDPRIRYGLIAVAALVALAVLRKMFR
jgi:Protein of unknown function (DUF3618)